MYEGPIDLNDVPMRLRHRAMLTRDKSLATGLSEDDANWAAEYTIRSRFEAEKAFDDFANQQSAQYWAQRREREAAAASSRHGSQAEDAKQRADEVGRELDRFLKRPGRHDQGATSNG